MPPFPGIPYGTAPFWCFPAHELTTYLLFFLCLLHAVRRGKAALAYLFGGLAFGLILEYLEVLGHSYTYGHFWIMLGHAPLDIPFCIGCGWAIILYTCRMFSDALRFPPLAAAALDTLLALNIDLSLDVVAYRLHMWHWYWDGTGLNPLTAQWFGIPYGNFIGWATVVFCYSFFSRLFERKLSHSAHPSVARIVLITFLALVASQVVLFATESPAFKFVAHHLGITSGRELLLIFAVMIALTIHGWARRSRPAQPMPALAKWVPTWFHLFCIASFFALGFFRENKAMTAIACANVLLGLAIHFYPWQHAPISSDNAEPVLPFEAQAT
jgi:uncharacterized membrane protein